MPTDLVLRVKILRNKFQIRTSSEASFFEIYRRISVILNQPCSSNWYINVKNYVGNRFSIDSSKEKYLYDIVIRSGDTLIVSYNDDPLEFNSDILLTLSNIDQILMKKDGKVPKSKSKINCRHGSQTKCLSCLPYEPFDEEYLKDIVPPIKHLPFHSFMKKILACSNRPDLVCLEEIDCKLKTGCNDHQPWPKAICTKCRPNTVTLVRQEYRHVDNILFENNHFVNKFLDYWRLTGFQRCGYLYGTYEPHPIISLGIRARICAIYEPPQKSGPDFIELLEDYDEKYIDEIALQFDLQKVGWIFTDLKADKNTPSLVENLRNVNTFNLSAQECIMSGYFQNKFPSFCKLSKNNKFGSKFVTLVVTGNKEGHIEFEGWQVSNQCVSLVRDNCLVPTIDSPSLGYIKETTDFQYIPEVLYKERDEYNNEVVKVARPMPIDFFLIQIPVGFSVNTDSANNNKNLLSDHFRIDINEESDDESTFKSNFPIENRSFIDQKQTERINNAFTVEYLNDFHYLIYFYKRSNNTFLRKKILDLCRQTRNCNYLRINRTIEEIDQFQETSNSNMSSFNPGSIFHESSVLNSQNVIEATESIENSSNVQWQCPHCTFINDSFRLNSTNFTVCSMCGIPPGDEEL